MKEAKKESYESPQLEIMETKVQNVICTSGDTLNDYPGNAW